MKNRLSNDHQQWDTIVLKKSVAPVSTRASAAVLSEEQVVERQKKISPVLRQNIQKARLFKKMTQLQLGLASNLTLATIQEYENGKRIFNEQEVKKLERALRCTLQRK
jgi:ribosome-binding protein aMBF1 (putative translation factor)